MIAIKIVLLSVNWLSVRSHYLSLHTLSETVIEQALQFLENKYHLIFILLLLWCLIHICVHIISLENTVKFIHWKHENLYSIHIVYENSHLIFDELKSCLMLNDEYNIWFNNLQSHNHENVWILILHAHLYYSHELMIQYRWWSTHSVI